MDKHVMPWWLGYVLISPLRRFRENPERLLGPYVSEGMSVLDVGPGMGFFTLPMARMVGPGGRVVAVDLQPRMLSALERRARKAGLSDRITTILCTPESLGLQEFQGAIDFALASAVVHEVPDPGHFFAQMREVLVPGGRLFLAEPPKRVSVDEFRATLERAVENGFVVLDRPRIRGRTDRSALLG